MASEKAEKRWFMQIDGSQQGPFTLAQLQAQVAKGRLTRTSAIREEAGGGWITAGQVPLIFAPPIRVESQPAEAPRSGSSPRRSSPPPSPPSLPAPPLQRKFNWPMAVAVGSGLVVFAVLLSVLALFNAGTDATLKNEEVAGDVVPSQPPSQSPVAPAMPSSVPSNSAQPPESAAANGVEAAASTSSASMEEKPRRDDSPRREMSTEELVAKTSRSVGIVYAGDGTGSCFLVEPGIVATNYHVIADCHLGRDRIEVRFPDALPGEQGPYPAEFVMELPDRDLALLKVKTALPALPIDSTHRFRRGQDIVTIGSPGLFESRKSLSNALTRGVLSAEITLAGLHHYQISNLLNPGNSGGPVLGMDGMVIGVAVGGSRTEQGLNFCIPASELANMLAASAKHGHATLPHEVAQHNARRAVRELTDATFALTETVVRMSDIFAAERTEQDFTTHNYTMLLKDGFKIEDPSILKDFTLEIHEVSGDPRLNAKQRSEVVELLRRQRSIHAMIDNPPSSFTRLSTSVKELDDQFFRQLKELNDVLEIGRPQLFDE